MAKLMDIHKFAELGNKGVLALMSDSTNVEKPGFTGSESSVGPAIKQAVGAAKGRVVLATFASNVSRIQQAIEVRRLCSTVRLSLWSQHGKCYRNRTRTWLLEYSTKHDYRRRCNAQLYR